MPSLSADTGVFSLTGPSATTARSAVLHAAHQGFGVSSYPQTFLHNILETTKSYEPTAYYSVAFPTGDAYGVVAAAGQYTLTGGNTGLGAQLVLLADAGEYTTTGGVAAVGRALAAASGTYNLTGGNTILAAHFELSAGAGEVTYVGYASTWLFHLVMRADSGEYNLAFDPNPLRLTRNLPALAGEFSIAGFDGRLYLSNFNFLDAEKFRVRTEIRTASVAQERRTIKIKPRRQNISRERSRQMTVR